MLDVNEYFDGNVKSIAFKTESLTATVGVMAPGNYVFNTADKEEVTVICGALTIKRPDDNEEKTFNAGESFNVPADCSFDVMVTSDTAYLCLYG